MKKVICGLLACIMIATPSIAATEDEILFKGIPWATDIETVKNSLETMRWSDWHGEGMDTCPTDSIIKDDLAYNRFAYTDINVHSITHNPDTKVAGYDIDEIDLYFAYVPDETGFINAENPDTSFYAASYHLIFNDLNGACNDLTEKLSSLYGDYDNQESEEQWTKTKTEWTYWNGANDTAVVLKKEDNTENVFDLKDAITIIYVWYKGDELLQNASDAIDKEKGSAESSVYGDGNTEGL